VQGVPRAVHVREYSHSSGVSTGAVVFAHGARSSERVPRRVASVGVQRAAAEEGRRHAQERIERE